MPCRWDAQPLAGLATYPREGGMDRLTLTLLGTLLAFLSALCLDSSGLQRVRRSALASRRETTGGDSPKNPGWAVLGLALLAASGLAGVLASLLP
jgi:hypothetical protein